MSILTAENVSYRYGKKGNEVLHGVNAQFEKGKLYVITGRSGAGKSTFLALISGLDRASSGRITYKDRDLAGMDLDAYRARDIGVIFQSFNLLRNRSAVENIMLADRISREKSRAAGRRRARTAGDVSKAGMETADVTGKTETTDRNDTGRIYRLLENLGITRETAERKVAHISGGEQQRVSIARAISHDPEIVMADEPTGNLDEKNSREIMEIFKRLACEQGKCVIVVSHSKNLWDYADEIVTIANGELNPGDDGPV